MLVVVSPAKRLDWAPVDGIAQTQPMFADDAARLARAAARLSRPALQKLMDISPDLAKLNQSRFRSFVDAPPPEATRPAAFAFAGDTYQGLEAATLSPDALRWADGHLRILSGLYGALRPTDAIQPYRLEMGSKLKVGRKGDLYGYWGDRIAEALHEQADRVKARCLLNCASVEYFSAVPEAALAVPVITPVFMETRGGTARIVSFYAKRARGAMARFVMENRLTDPAALHGFDAGGYRHDAAQSTQTRPVFLRDADAAAAA